MNLMTVNLLGNLMMLDNRIESYVKNGSQYYLRTNMYYDFEECEWSLCNPKKTNKPYYKLGTHYAMQRAGSLCTVKIAESGSFSFHFKSGNVIEFNKEDTISFVNDYYILRLYRGTGKKWQTPMSRPATKKMIKFADKISLVLDIDPPNYKSFRETHSFIKLNKGRIYS